MKQIFNLCFTLLLSSIVILQSGCGDEKTNDPHPDVTANSDTISGTVQYKTVDNNGIISLADWHFGPAMVRATADGANIATAALSSDGNFILILPQTVSGTHFNSAKDFAQTLGGSLVISSETIYFVGPIVFFVDYTDNGVAKSMEVDLSTFVLFNNKPVFSRLYTYNYYDQDGSFTGTDFYGNAFNWTFAKGWGMVESYGNSNSSTTTSMSVNAAPGGAVWVN